MWYCETCEQRFLYEADCFEHMDRFDHWARYPCEVCDREFLTEEEAEFHMMVKRHYTNYCFDCDRVLCDDNALRMVRFVPSCFAIPQLTVPQHLNSSIHREENNFCPFCDMGYSTPSGVCAHLESGSCYNAPTLNRMEVHLKIEHADPYSLITDRHVTVPGEVERPEGWTRMYRDGNYFECPLCEKLFRTAQSLIQHLNSPAHRQRLYHCPNKDECPKKFNSLAGLCAHLESGSCGFMRFEHVCILQEHLNRALRGESFINFRRPPK